MQNEHADEHAINDDVDEDSASQEVNLTRVLSGGASVTEPIAYPENAPEAAAPDSSKADLKARSISWIPVRFLILLCGFLTSLSFGVTQVPLLYAFRLMTCDGYYKSHPNHTHEISLSQQLDYSSAPLDVPESLWSSLSGLPNASNDRCSIHPIETSTALSITLLGASLTVFGIVNLFLTGILIKRIGVQRTLVIQVFFPGVRLVIQNVGIEVWGYTGILIFQCSQIINILGGPSGYILALNQFITEVVSSEQRTPALGRLAGTMLFGSAFGFLLGGILAEEMGIKAPFRLTLTLFLVSAAFAALFLPYVPPPSSSPGNDSNAGSTTPDEPAKQNSKSKNKFFEPLLTFWPRKFVLKDGRVQTEYGALLLACGVFLGIVATGYLPTLLQLYSTNVFGFGTKENGWLTFMYSLLRGVFLSFAFPQLIATGRKYIGRRHTQAQKKREGQNDDSVAPEQQPLLGSQGHETETGKVEEQATKRVYTFDLTYTRFSIFADGLLTFLCSFLREGWQLYLVAAILPFAAGTGSAAKGTVLHILGDDASSADRVDALAGISLVENLARLATMFSFGVVFAGFTNIGRPELVFVVNGACALTAFVVLLFARFPPEDSVRLDRIDKTSEQDPVA